MHRQITYTRICAFALVLQALLGHAGATFAAQASFDCKAAALVDEKLICSDPLLSKADASLAKTYFDLLSAADQARHVALHNDQRNWLLLRNTECGVEKTTNITEDNRAAYVDCFLAAYEERAADLDTMKANPQKPPAEISSPIRKSRFAADAPSAVSVLNAIPTQMMINGSTSAVWSSDGQLVALAELKGHTDKSLYAWKPGHDPIALSTAIDDAARVESLCIRNNVAFLVRKTSDSKAFESAMIPLTLSLTPTTPSWKQGPPACNEAHIGTSQDGHFLTLERGGKSIALQPPIQWDRRLSLHATYMPGTDTFVVNAGNRPNGLRDEIERRWAKFDCLPFWKVNASTGDDQRICIPYGTYVKTIPEPLPTRHGVFFAAGNAGLYKVTEDSAEPIISGDVENPTLSNDQCFISFAGAANADGSHPLQAVNICSVELKKK